ncbi:MAG: FAD-dependent oxidoreductase [Gammaproteobacteria bacterium]|nr:FAD-dependent oxidoreductase [Gammaproteobacteria bacterium]MCP4090791.1 FAD-dependent oxidoreductase [Gammaproteobacteria bacterium]MCP4277218.1 FAD-dependent oxidoreductase [Gammaproteobacteria bacterium]MCP4832840.1 FAD-dependent oxidoreductase [Gammaproteobacteria bacterium]MCP4928939.1 FAD-dependent oxidoreductase [Gammaproteobacteria bacterium]
MQLLEPGHIGTMELKNRVIMPAMGIRGTVEEDGDWGDRAIAYYTARAAGGVGLIMPEMVFTSRALELAARGCIDLASDEHLKSVRRLADSLEQHGCKLGIQLTAGFGRVVPPFILPEWWTDDPLPEDLRPVSASLNDSHYLPDKRKFDSRALTTEEAAAHAESFGPAARRAREGGAACVELHGHEGYLLDQFMTALWNCRDDHYGGSVDKRLNFAREAIAAIKREAGEDFPVIYRFGLTHYLPGGREPEEGLYIAGELEKMGVAALHVDAGCYETHWWPHPPQYQEPGCMVSLAEQVKAQVDIPVIAVGRLQYPDIAERVLVENKADFVAMGRGLLADPELVNKVAAEQPDDIIPCIGCHEGCLWQMAEGKPTSCAVRPTTGHEIEWPLLPVKQTTSLLVIGGGPAGIEAARAGVERGFDVTLWEASNQVGGNLWPAAKPDFKLDITRYLNYLRKLLHDLPVNVVLNKHGVAKDITDFGADYVVLATGAKMEALPFESSASVKVLTAIDLLNDKETVQGEHVLVMGGGLVGCETAVYLARQGKQVTLTTRRGRDKLGGDIVDRSNREMLIEMVKDADIQIHDNSIPLRLADGSVVLQTGMSTNAVDSTERSERDELVDMINEHAKDSALANTGAKSSVGEITVTADSLVFAGRLLPQDSLVQELTEINGHASKILSAGDCVKVDSIMNAVWGSFTVVREIAA